MSAALVRTAALACLLLAAGCDSNRNTRPPPVPTAASPSHSVPTSADARSSVPVSSGPSGTGDGPQDWPTYHGNVERTGLSTVMPAATGRLSGRRVDLGAQVYASPIVFGTAGSDPTVVVATERNRVYGLTLAGAIKWSTALGDPTPRAALPCGNIDPLGITGTPVFDSATSTVFAVASIGRTVRHELVALDALTGSIRWRQLVDLPGPDPQAMQQRGALIINAGRVWVPFGGLAGDCGAYKGRLVGVPVAGGAPVAFTVPTSREGGIWTPPGPTVSGSQLLVAVGNGESVGARYDYSDSVLALEGTRLVDSFSPSSWATDNAHDLDLGSQGPAVVQGRWVFIAGKSGTAYVLRLGRLGGIGGQVSQGSLCASFGGTAIVGDTVYVPCSDGVRAVRISAAGALSQLWRTAAAVNGSPVVGGGRVYSLDPDGGVLHALDPATGRTVEQLSVGLTSRFATPAISGTRLFVPTLRGITVVDTR